MEVTMVTKRNYKLNSYNLHINHLAYHERLVFYLHYI